MFRVLESGILSAMNFQLSRNTFSSVSFLMSTSTLHTAFSSFVLCYRGLLLWVKISCTMSHDAADTDDELFDQLEAELEQDGTFNHYREQQISQLQTTLRRKSNIQAKLRNFSTEKELMDLISSSEMKLSNYVIVFINDTFASCQILIRALSPVIADSDGSYTVCVINAFDAPFLSDKLAVKVLPAIVAYSGGRNVGTKAGLDGLLDDPMELETLNGGKLARLFQGYFPCRSGRGHEGEETDYSD